MASLHLGSQRCPKGTVAIVRATKEDLLMEKYIPSHPGSHMETEDSPESADIPGQNLFSLAEISVVAASGADLNNVQTGWMKFDSHLFFFIPTRTWTGIKRQVAIIFCAQALHKTQTRETGGWGSTVNKLDIGRDHYSLHCYQTLTQWLGEARFSAPFNTPTPEMGSGHHPSEGLWKVASMTHLRASLPFSSTMFVDPDNYDSFFVRRTRMLRCNLR
ncbi:hypothetical protein CRG98_028682 [Punica granatum]|uniref:Neprosin PEP catalytic domain-containing protein n=1 Tax=Punica granatum TaxID=22663 RepID=A0A2I0J408_PUNGR|nr:hypothetical protein CRG98_028682 [Punica granatum]